MNYSNKILPTFFNSLLQVRDLYIVLGEIASHTDDLNYKLTEAENWIQQLTTSLQTWNLIH